jgi:hypothetical protein
MLDELGSPSDIVVAAQPERLVVTRGAREISALLLLFFGGILLPPIGWLADVALSVMSPLWTKWQKLLGIVILPIGFYSALYLLYVLLGYAPSPWSGLSGGLPSMPSVYYFFLSSAIIAFPTSIAAAVYLYRAAGRPR